MTFNKNVYFQNNDENLYNEIYPFFINLKQENRSEILK